MASIHQRIARRINDVLIPSLKGLNVRQEYQPVSVDFEDDPDETTEIHMCLTGLGLMARLYLKDKEWILWIFKANKDGSVSKRFPEKFVQLAVPRESFTDDSFVLREFMRTVLSLESQSDSAGGLMADPLFQNHYKPAMKAALQNPYIVSTREEKERKREDKANEQAKQESKIWFWIIGIFVVLFLLTSNRGSELPNDCNFVPDPRGGYSDC